MNKSNKIVYPGRTFIKENYISFLLFLVFFCLVFCLGMYSEKLYVQNSDNTLDFCRILLNESFKLNKECITSYARDCLNFSDDNLKVLSDQINIRLPHDL